VNPRRTPSAGEVRHGKSGQALYEFAILVPVFLLILLGMLEFGYMFVDNLTLAYATREGARAGAAFGNGTLPDQACVAGGGTVGAGNVDQLIIDAVQGVLESPGSQLNLADVQNITIYEADANGNPIVANVWGAYNQGKGPLVPCTASTTYLDFPAPTSTPWPASLRTNAAPNIESIGVSISYQYQFRTPLGGILHFLGGSNWTSLTINDRTVMALEPIPTS
jgi:hypothetical protein